MPGPWGSPDASVSLAAMPAALPVFTAEAARRASSSRLHSWHIPTVQAACSAPCRGLLQQAFSVVDLLVRGKRLAATRAVLERVDALAGEVVLAHDGQLKLLGELDGLHGAGFLTAAAKDAAAVVDRPGDGIVRKVGVHANGIGRTSHAAGTAGDAELGIVLGLAAHILVGGKRRKRYLTVASPALALTFQSFSILERLLIERSGMVPSPASGDLSRQTFSNCSLSSTWSRLAATSVTVTRSVQE